MSCITNGNARFSPVVLIRRFFIMRRAETCEQLARSEDEFSRELALRKVIGAEETLNLANEAIAEREKTIHAVDQVEAEVAELGAAISALPPEAGEFLQGRLLHHVDNVRLGLAHVHGLLALDKVTLILFWSVVSFFAGGSGQVKFVMDCAGMAPLPVQAEQVPRRAPRGGRIVRTRSGRSKRSDEIVMGDWG